MMDCTKVSYASKGFANHKKALHHQSNCALQARQHAPWKTSDLTSVLAIQHPTYQTPHYAQNRFALQADLNDPQQTNHQELATQHSSEHPNHQATQLTSDQNSNQASEEAPKQVLEQSYCQTLAYSSNWSVAC